MTELPLVSVLMTAFNRQEYIAEAIESVIVSSYTRWELIIVDDCSNDNTVLIAKNYASADCRIRLYLNEKNLGDYPNRNKAASYAAGELILYVDSDDVLYPDTIEKIVKVMIRFPAAGYAVYTPIQVKEAYYLNSGQVIRKHFFESPVLMYGPVAMVMRNQFFKEINYFPIKYGPANDMYFQLKAAANAGCVILPFPLVYYRRHDGQEINNKNAYLYNNYLYLRDALAEIELPLSQNDIKYLNYKNKRRFSVNLVKTLFKSLNINIIALAIRKSDFTLLDFLEGIFHLTPKPRP